MSLFDTPEKRIQAAHFVDGLFKNEWFLAIEARMERGIYEEFLNGKTSEDRVQAWAKAKVVRNLRSEMQKVIDQGELDIMAIAAEEKKRQRKKP